MSKTNEHPLNKMETEPIPSLLVSMSWPAILSMTIAALYNMVDSIYVSRVSPDALTAVSYVIPMHLLMISVAVGSGVGVNSLIARRLGARRYEEADKAASASVVIAAVNWLIFLMIGLFAAKPFVSAYTDDPLIFGYAYDYLSIVTVFSFGLMTELILEKVLQGTGSMVLPMIISTSGALTNIILDPVFIFGMFGVPRMEVKGAAIATVIGQFVSLAVAVVVFTVREHDVKISIKNMKPDFRIIKDIYVVGLPTIVMQSIASVMLLVYNWILSSSEAAVAVLGVYFKVESFVFMPVFGLQQGALPLLGYNYGARNRTRFLDTYKVNVLISLVIMAAGTAVFQLAPEAIMELFKADEEMMEIGVRALRVISLCFIPAAFGVATGTVFQATGHGLYCLIESVIRQFAGVLPIAYVLTDLYGVNASWYSFPIAEILGLGYGVIMFLVLYRKEIRDLETADRG